ncbi:hypothetical protein [Rothia nasimurium]|uniref:hypothetical protein n=2 Tax=Rothia nasimurium TaxID=85336 RepID=UPI001F3598C7|nr:hypothetical protein [Rothia nasimurium]
MAGAISGAALSGGLSILTNKNEDGTVDWKKVGLDTVIGGVAGGVGGAAVSLVGKASSLMNAGRATRTALKAERVGAKAGALAQKASGASWYNPMKYMNSWRAQQFGQRAASLSARADEFSQFAAHYGDVGGFARSMSGQTVQGVATNVTSNNLAYATGDFKEHTAGGYARATVSGVGVGVVSPRITPLRQQVFSSANPDAGLVEKTLRPVTAFAADRFADFGVGVGNYVVTPQEKDLTWDDAFKEGVKSTVGGGAGEFSTRRADGVRPATPRMSGE